MKAILNTLDVIRAQALYAKDALMRAEAATDPEEAERLKEEFENLFSYLESKVLDARVLVNQRFQGIETV